MLLKVALTNSHEERVGVIRSGNGYSKCSVSSVGLHTFPEPLLTRSSAVQE